MSGSLRIDFDPTSLTLARSNRAEEGAAPARAAGGEGRLREAEEAARNFETLFMDIMMKSMRKTAMPEDASNALDIYQGMLDSEYTKSMSSGGGLGIQNMVLDWMKTVEPALQQAGGGEKSGDDLKAGRKAMNEMALQQYRMQAALPLPE